MSDTAIAPHAGQPVLTAGAPLNASDAWLAGLADVVLPHESLSGLLDTVSAERWHGDRDVDGARLTEILARFATDDLPPANLTPHLSRIDDLIGDDAVAEIAPRLAALAGDDDRWLAQAGATFTHGSPTSAALSVEMQRRARTLAPSYL